MINFWYNTFVHLCYFGFYGQKCKNLKIEKLQFCKEKNMEVFYSIFLPASYIPVIFMFQMISFLIIKENDHFQFSFTL